ncbi:extracellular solute-binding protein [Butyrivibrio sp. AC2005]|uniref:extracellular solute-binding protein n=1 Tax=Butyrivibrio sp. AC2005 TaxID=1280672 RepID=UPI00040FF87A|nr:extracellular solute-binding protein [Butyrivibrio sp. AC2005]
MRIFSRTISTILTITLLFSCAGCSIFEEKENATSDYAMDDENYITCMVWDRGNFPEGYSADDNALANWIRAKVKEEYGINLHFISVDRSTSDSTIKKMVDEGTAPDIIFTYSSSVFGYMTKQGKVADLTESLEKYGDNIKEYIGDIQYMGSYNDLQVAVMKRRGFKSPRHMAYIRRDWCDMLGLPVPTNKKELIDYLYAVKENNPGEVDGVIPWAMGGDVNSERFYQGFVGSYVNNLSDRDAYIYSERYMVVADGAVDGLRELNRLYNDGIISLDFTADKDNSAYVKDVTEGKAGFFVDDAMSPFTYISELKAKDSSVRVDPVLCFDLQDGGYRNVAEPDYGMYVMVPAISKNKTDAAIKYLNWLADPEIAEMVNYTPDHKNTKAGAPMAMAKDELYAMGYSGNPDDYCIVNGHFSFVDRKDGQVSTWVENCPWESQEWFNHLYDLCVEDQFTFPSTSMVLDTEVKYSVELDTALVEYAYNLICCPSVDFDNLQKDEYEHLKSLGLEEVLEERGRVFDSGAIKVKAE